MNDALDENDERPVPASPTRGSRRATCAGIRSGFATSPGWGINGSAPTADLFAKLVDKINACTTMHPMSKRRTAAAMILSTVAGFFVWKYPGPMAHLAVCLLAAGLLVLALAWFAHESKGGSK